MNQYFQVSSLSISLSVEGPIAKKVQRMDTYHAHVSTNLA